MPTRPKPARRSANDSRLSVQDWIDAGLRILAEEGLAAIKLERLCAQMGVTRGSFYWHFTDMQAYLDAISETYADARDAARGQFDAMTELEPRERLIRMAEFLAEPHQWMMERAVREWARSEPRVAEHVRAYDRAVLRAVTRAFTDAGFKGADAETRARALYFAGIGFLHVAHERQLKRGARQRAAFIDIMLA